MAEIETIVARKRGFAGKGAARAARREGLVPGVVYGGKEPPVMISMDYPVLMKALKRGGFMNHQFMLDLGEGAQVRVIPRDLQLDVVRDFPLHVDFLRLVKGATLRLQIPVRFTGEGTSPGIKRGGVLNIVRHEIELVCPVDAIPEFILCDISALDIADSLHISAVTLPENVHPAIADRDFTIASIAAPTVAEIETQVAATTDATAAAAAPAAGGKAPAAGAKAPAAGAKAAEGGGKK